MKRQSPQTSASRELPSWSSSVTAGPCLRHSTGIRDWPKGAPLNDVGGSSSAVGPESTGPTSMKTFPSRACWRVADQWRALRRCDGGVPHVNDRLPSEWSRRGADRIAARLIRRRWAGKITRSKTRNRHSPATGSSRRPAVRSAYESHGPHHHRSECPVREALRARDAPLGGRHPRLLGWRNVRGRFVVRFSPADPRRYPRLLDLCRRAGAPDSRHLGLNRCNCSSTNNCRRLWFASWPMCFQTRSDRLWQPDGARSTLARRERVLSIRTGLVAL